jgi:hypothetical protein
LGTPFSGLLATGGSSWICIPLKVARAGPPKLGDEEGIRINDLPYGASNSSVISDGRQIVRKS